MDWGYTIPDEPVSAAPAPALQDANAIAAPSALDDPTTMKREAEALQALIPAEFAQLLTNPSLSDAQKIDLAKELIHYNQAPTITANDVASAPPEIREALAQLKERKDEIAAQEQQLIQVFAAPAAALAAPAMAVAAPVAAPENSYGMTIDRISYLDMGPTTAVLAFNPPAPSNVPDVRAALGIATDRGAGRSV